MSWLKQFEPKSPRGWFGASAVMLALSLILSAFNAASTLAAPLQVTVPTKVGFEGYLTDPTNSPNPLPTDNYSIVFSLYSAASGGTASWTETQTVSVQDGYFAVQLGSVAPLYASDFSGNQWIGVKVGTDAEISPRTPISAVPFALNAETANSATTASSVPWSGVSSKPAGFADGVDDNSGGTITGSGTAGQLPAWTSGTALGNSGIVASAGKITSSIAIAARVQRSGSYSIANNTLVAIPFNAERTNEDPLLMHDNTTNPSRITVPVAGFYILTCGVRFNPGSTASIRSVNLYVSGVEVGAGNVSALASQAVHVDATTVAYMTTNQYAECYVYQNSGAALDITVSAQRSIEFAVARLP